MATILWLDQGITIPECPSLEAFLAWARSEEFPERGRLDFVGDRVEVDMSPEALFSHGEPKVELVAVLQRLVRGADEGYVFADATRVTVPAARLSVEPDVVVLLYDSIDSGRVRLVPKTGRGDDAVEIEGPPDLIAEVVSDSSATKDTGELREAYLRAGVREYWIVDARGDELVFEMLVRAGERWEACRPDGEGFRASSVLRRAIRLDRDRDRAGRWRYRLLHTLT